jgi:O-antigen/teichoic acid export membrane protein
MRLTPTTIMVIVALAYIFLWSGLEGVTSPVAVQIILLFIGYFVVIALAGLGALQLSYAYVAGRSTMMIVALFLLRRSEVRWHRPTLVRSYLRFALPVSLTVFCTSIALNINTVFVQWFGARSEVGYFSSGFALLGIFGFIGVAVSTLSFPEFSRLHSTGDTVGIRRITLDAERYISMVGTPVLMVIALFPREIAVLLLGTQFVNAGDPMRFLAIARFISMLGQAGMPPINAVNRPGVLAKIVSFTLVLNIFLLFTFVPASFLGFGMLGMSYLGAALVSVIVASVTLAAVHLTMWRLTGTGFNTRILVHLLCAGVSGGAVASLVTICPLTWLLSLGIVAVVAAGLHI